MHLEYASYLTSILHEIDWSSVCGLSVDEIPMSQILGQIGNIEIDDCPYDFESNICSSIAYRIVSVLERCNCAKSLQVLTPEILAKKVIEISKKRKDAYFSLSVGGQGYINACVTDRFVKDFCVKVFESNGACLFRRQSVFVSKQIETQTLVWDFAKLFNISLLRKRVEQSSNKDAKEYAEIIFSRAETTVDDIVQLLAMMYDNEIEAKNYLANLKGSENVPWIMKRCLLDMQKYITTYKSYLNPQGFLAIKWQDTKRTNINSEVDLFLSNALSELLFFRSVINRSFKKLQGELFVGALTRIVHCFYSYYNHPKYRSLDNLQSSIAVDIVTLSNLLKFVLEQGILVHAELFH